MQFKNTQHAHDFVSIELNIALKLVFAKSINKALKLAEMIFKAHRQEINLR